MERKLLFVLLSAIVVISAVLVTQELITSFPPGSVADEAPAFSGSADSLVNRLNEAYGIMQSNFYEPERLMESNALSAGLKGMIQYIRDPEHFNNQYITAFTRPESEIDLIADNFRGAEADEIDWDAIYDQIDDLTKLELDDLRAELDEVYGELDSTSPDFDIDLLNDTSIADAGIRTMVAALEDPYSRYNTWEEYMSFTTDLNGEEYEGIGAFIELRNGFITVSSPIKGGPAENSGIRAGDAILTINEESTRGFSTGDATKLLRGDKGTDVTVEVRRTTGQVEEISITRDRIKVPSVASRLVEPEIGMVSINRFGDSTTQEVEEALKELEAQSSELQGLIIDLRNNGGGYLRTARDIASLFIDRGNTIVIQKERENEFPFTSTDNTRPNLPIAVLINRGTASASEILAGAIRDNDMGVLIGEQTFGKGVIQTPLRVGFDSRLILTTAEYLTPDRHPVQEIGLSPAPGFEVPSWFDTYMDIEYQLSVLAGKVVEGLKGDEDENTPAENEGAEGTEATESAESETASTEHSAGEEAIILVGEELADLARMAFRDEYDVALVQLKELHNFLERDPQLLLDDTEMAYSPDELEIFSSAYAQFLTEMDPLLQEVEDRLVNNDIEAALKWLKMPGVLGTLCPCDVAADAVSSGESAESN